MMRITLSVGKVLAIGFVCTVLLLSVNCFHASNNRKVAHIERKNKELAIWPFKSQPEETGVAIIDAVLSKNLDTVKANVARNPDSINDKTSDGANAMHLIAKLGHYKYPPDDIPKFLIDSKLNINEKNNEGKTALVISLLSGWQKISMLLLDNGADTSGVTNEVKQKITCPDCKRVVRQYNL